MPTATIDKNLLGDIIQWDVRIWSQALELWERKVDWSKVETCLDLGAGRGGLSLWMALKHKHVICSDVEPSTRAREHHQKYDLDGYVEYATIDATNIPYENQIDIITIKSVIVNIGGGDDSGKQQAAVDQMYKALRPGGKLLFAENLVGSPIHRFVRKRFVKWGAWCRYVTVAEMKHFLRNFSKVELHTTGVFGAFGRTERQRSALGVADNALFNHVTPKAWQYLVYGIAEK